MNLVVRDINQSYSGLEMTQSLEYAFTNTGNVALNLTIPQDFLGQTMVKPTHVIDYAINDSLGRDFQVSVSQTPNETMYDSPQLEATVQAHSSYAAELWLLMDAGAFAHDGPFVVGTGFTQTTYYPMPITLAIPTSFTLLGYSGGGTPSSSPSGVKIVWQSFTGEQALIWAKFLPFHSTNTNLASWTAFALQREQDIGMNVSQIYPTFGTADISYHAVTDIPQTINGIRYDPNIPVGIQLPGLGEVVRVISASDQDGALQRIYQAPQNSSGDVGKYYFNTTSNEIWTYPHPISINGFYEYEVTADYVAGIKGATQYVLPWSAKGSILGIANPNSNVAPSAQITFYVQVLLPSGTSPDAGLTTGGYSISSVGGRSQLTWKESFVAGNFTSKQWIVGYQIDQVQTAVIYSIGSLVVAFVALAVSLRMRRRKSIAVPVGVNVSAIGVLVGEIETVTSGVILGGGLFSYEAGGIAVLCSGLLIWSLVLTLRRRKKPFTKPKRAMECPQSQGAGTNKKNRLQGNSSPASDRR